MELPTNAALLVVDIQIAINRPEKGPRNNPRADENVARLLTAWRKLGRPIFHVKDNSTSLDSAFHPSKPGNAIQPYAQPLPGEPLIEKETHSAFIGTDLEAQLRSAGIDTVVIAGFVTNHCVEATARVAGDLGFSYLRRLRRHRHPRPDPPGRQSVRRRSGARGLTSQPPRRVRHRG